MPTCDLSPSDKRAFGKAVGHDLLTHHGKSKYYTRDQITASCERLGYPVDWYCWAMCLFMLPSEFTSYHESIGESCDLVSMKSEMVAALTDGASSSWFDLDLSWLDWPDIDLSNIFDFFDWD